MNKSEILRDISRMVRPGPCWVTMDIANEVFAVPDRIESGVVAIALAIGGHAPDNQPMSANDSIRRFCEAESMSCEYDLRHESWRFWRTPEQMSDVLLREEAAYYDAKRRSQLEVGAE